VTNVVAPPNGLPGQSVEVTWTTTNQGDGPATGPWTEQVFIASQAGPGGEQLLATFSYGGLPRGGSIDQSHAIGDSSLLRSGNRWVLIRTDAGNALFEHNETNNLTPADQPINLRPALRLTLSTHSIGENAGSNALSGTISRNTDTTAELVVTLASSDTNSAELPLTATIPAGQSAINIFHQCHP